MQRTQLDIVPFGTQHLEGALALSRQAGWPHRLADWEMALALSIGVVVLENDKVVGTTLTTRFGGCATINMVIVAEAMRGQGLGRRLMEAGLDASQGEPCRLVATQDGLPLYEKVGFRQVGDILQCQGFCAAVEAPIDVEWMQSGDLAEIAALDEAAFGADRRKLISYMKNIGRFAVIRRDERIVGFSATRAFGRGGVIGPVVAENLDDARKLIQFQIADRRDRFLRIDTPKDSGLSQWLAECGLVHVGGATAMQRGGGNNPAGRDKTFALANQAFG
jgi:GNAT superfamily N-acetyltransferase